MKIVTTEKYRTDTAINIEISVTWINARKMQELMTHSKSGTKLCGTSGPENPRLENYR